MNVFVLFIEFENENKDHIVKMNIILQCLFNNEISDNLKVNFIIYTMKNFFLKFGACVLWAPVFFQVFWRENYRVFNRC